MGKFWNRTKFWKWLCDLDPAVTKVIRVKSLKPHWDDYVGAIAWPTLHIEINNHLRETITPLWTWERIRHFFFRR
jgi:hypothetical protein